MNIHYHYLLLCNVRLTDRLEGSTLPLISWPPPKTPSLLLAMLHCFHINNYIEESKPESAGGFVREKNRVMSPHGGISWVWVHHKGPVSRIRTKLVKGLASKTIDERLLMSTAIITAIAMRNCYCAPCCDLYVVH